ncbi:MAG: hypothetical protein A3G18_01335 [Rhodospirillales bacterium RIFCSPLOWO2_12_FULL_58_28]|nr:MAG: hypothetical protein A3H92_04535 [Rhodospirillales bacterium RIFCSPLOWO2_02_FULL_58_16]OHC78043.1 MAG: hypothetical protein A3G18_01335 [Rhodospirillales bacterium RIFCSPLOWO2_12_FULL_58_28]
MSNDIKLLVLVAVVWLLLALAYALVPMLNMPGGALAWGSGAALFMLLAFWAGKAERAGKM